MDDRNGLLKGGNSGPAVVPGQPEKSLLIRPFASAAMPRRCRPKKQLTDEQIADLTHGSRTARPGRESRCRPSLGKSEPDYEQLRKEHWAWQPLTRRQSRRRSSDAAWPRDDIDRFILARLEDKGLKPVGRRRQASR